MSAPNWTPFPWTVAGEVNDPGCYYIEQVDDHVTEIRDKGRGDIPRAEAVTEANERLIGAAEPLYGALEPTVNALDMYAHWLKRHGDNKGHDSILKIHDRARAALSLALNGPARKPVPNTPPREAREARKWALAHQGDREEPAGMPGETCLACGADLSGIQRPSDHACEVKP